MSDIATLLENLCQLAQDTLGANPEQIGYIIICGDKTGAINLRSNMPSQNVMVAMSTMVQKQSVEAANRIFQLEATLAENADPNKQH